MPFAKFATKVFTACQNFYYTVYSTFYFSLEIYVFTPNSLWLSGEYVDHLVVAHCIIILQCQIENGNDAHV